MQNITSSPSVAHGRAILSDEMNPGDTSSASANAPPPTLVEKSDVRTYDGKTDSTTRKYNTLCRFFERGFCRLKKKCRFLHICLNFRSKCCNKNDCSFDHVDLCSVLTCTNRECVFAHVTPDFRTTSGRVPTSTPLSLPGGHAYRCQRQLCEYQAKNSFQSLPSFQSPEFNPQSPLPLPEYPYFSISFLFPSPSPYALFPHLFPPCRGINVFEIFRKQAE